MSNKWKNKNFIEALKNAFNGLIYIFKTQRNFKIQLVFAIFALLLGVILKITSLEFLILLLVIGLVIFSEILNTIIETIVDMYTEEYNEKAKIAKDAGATIPLVMSGMSVMVRNNNFFT